MTGEKQGETPLALCPGERVLRLSVLEAREQARRESRRQAPLGVLPESRLDESQLRSLAAIEDFDLSPVRERLVRSGAMTPGWADEATFEFRRYLGLRAVFPMPITMVSPDVDEVWHACILHTRLYADLCERAFGQFLHHDPDTEPNGDRRAAWDEFEGAYRILYGETGPLWEMSRPAQPRRARLTQNQDIEFAGL
ncbi:MAG: hypothetical protein HW416_2265 [Chloroflexi bacterium]|nr:hypothetical protein [Chloroflexota bacterium]